MVEILFEEVKNSTFGQKMFNRIATLVSELSDETEKENLAEIARHLQYHPSASAPQRIVFSYLAELAAARDWRGFVDIYGNLMHPYQCLNVLKPENRFSFFS